MKIGQANIRSLNTSSDIIDLVCTKQDIEIMCLSEIWHPDNKITGKIMKKWNWIASERKEREGGGVGIMLSKQLKFIERKDLWSKEYEAEWCNVYTNEHSF